MLSFIERKLLEIIRYDKWEGENKIFCGKMKVTTTVISIYYLGGSLLYWIKFYLYPVGGSFGKEIEF